MLSGNPYVTRNAQSAHQLIQNTWAGMLSLSSGVTHRGNIIEHIPQHLVHKLADRVELAARRFDAAAGSSPELVGASHDLFKAWRHAEAPGVTWGVYLG